MVVLRKVEKWHSSNHSNISTRSAVQATPRAKRTARFLSLWGLGVWGRAPVLAASARGPGAKIAPGNFCVLGRFKADFIVGSEVKHRHTVNMDKYMQYPFRERNGAVGGDGASQREVKNAQLAGRGCVERRTDKVRMQAQAVCVCVCVCACVRGGACVLCCPFFVWASHGTVHVPDPLNSGFLRP